MMATALGWISIFNPAEFPVKTKAKLSDLLLNQDAEEIEVTVVQFGCTNFNSVALVQDSCSFLH